MHPKKLLTLLLFLSINVSGQNQIRVMSYNLHNYPNYLDADFKKVINLINPDIIVAVEVIQQAGVNQFLNSSLSSEYSATPATIRGTNSSGYDGNDCAIYFKNAKLTLLEYYEIPARTRVISTLKLKHNTTNDTLIVFGVHLKANDYSSDNVLNAQKRADAVQSLRGVIYEFNSKTNFLVCGDFNIFSSNEEAFSKLVDQTYEGYFIDMLNLYGDWSGNAIFNNACTYSTSTLDTRLDMILISQALKDPGGIDYVEGSFKIFGNDGDHFGKAINIGTNKWFADPSVGNSLRSASDHLPIYADFNFGVVSNVDEIINVPPTFELDQNYPNPFNPETTISFRLPRASFVTLKVYDLLGRELKTLVNEEKLPGNYKIEFHSDITQRGLAGGTYFYQLKVGNFVQTKKMILLK